MIRSSMASSLSRTSSASTIIGPTNESVPVDEIQDTEGAQIRSSRNRIPSQTIQGGKRLRSEEDGDEHFPNKRIKLRLSSTRVLSRVRPTFSYLTTK